MKKEITTSKAVSAIFFGITYVLLSYYFLFILSKKVFHYTLAECRIGKPKINLLWLALGVILPVAVSALLMLTPGYFDINI